MKAHCYEGHSDGQRALGQGRRLRMLRYEPIVTRYLYDNTQV